MPRLTRIDHLITTHYHGDHFGAMSELAEPHPDRGLHRPRPERAGEPRYRRVPERRLSRAARESEAHGREARRPRGDARRRHPHRRVRGRADSRRGPRRGAGESAVRRASAEGRGPERERSVGRQPFHVRPFPRAASRRPHLEQGVRARVPAKPAWARWTCSSSRTTVSRCRIRPSLVHAIAPRVAIMNNGTRKGGQPDAMKVLFSSPGLEDLWQLHFSLLSGQEYTVPGAFIANVADEQPRRCRSSRSPLPRRARAQRRRRRTTAPRSGSRWRRATMARSRSRTRATASARATRQLRGKSLRLSAGYRPRGRPFRPN